MAVWQTLPFTLLRMLRNYLVALLLLVVPLVLITFFSFLLSGVVNEQGEPYLNENALTMVLSFQLFGGSIVMSYIHEDLFTANGKRFAMLPMSTSLYALSVLSCGTLYSIGLGGILMGYAQWVLGVNWSHTGWIVYIVTLVACLSSVVSLLFTFSVRSFKVAERLTEFYGIGFILLAGLFFPMPKHVIFDFLGSYGNPLTLALGAVRQMQADNLSEAWLHANLLSGALGLLLLIVLVLGRRRIR